MPTAQPVTQQPDHLIRYGQLPLASRTMDLRGFRRTPPGADSGQGAATRAGGAAQTSQSPLATAQLVFTTGASVRRYDDMRDRTYLETLVVDAGAIRLDRLQRGAPVLNTHNSWELEAQLGVAENPVIEAGAGVCDVTFSRRPSVAGYVQDVEDRVIRNVSVGYVRHRIEMVPPMADGGTWEYRVIDWEPYEVSLVPIPADLGSQVRSADGQPPAAALDTRTFPCEFIERARPDATSPSPVTHPQKDLTMPTLAEQAAATAAAQEAATRQQATAGVVNPAPTGAAPGAAPATAPDAAAAATRAATDAATVAATHAATQRAADITALCSQHNVPHLAAGLIRAGQDMTAVRGAILDELALRSAAGGGHRNTTNIRTVTDEMQVRMAGMEQAISHRVSAATQLDDNGRQYRGHSLLELGRMFLDMHGQDTRGLSKLELASRILTFRAAGAHGTSDFASLFANVAAKRLRGAYDENPGSYRMWARRAPNAPDFKNISVVNLSGAPELLKVNEHGEFTYGTMKDGAETYAVLTYGRILNLTRQSIINDDLRGFDRMVSAFGNSASRLENRLVYSRLTANANLADGGALFNATAITTAGGHANLASGGGSALQASSLVTARTAMRVQKGLAGEELNIVPAYLIVPAALEQTAYQLTSANYVAATQANVSEFRAGGRTALEPIVEPILDASSATAWYLAANSGQIDTVEYCYLDGAEGPVIESEPGFEVDGVSWKCRLDFAAKEIDFRGLYKSAGA